MRAIRLGFACNNACVFCAQGDRRLALGDVDGQLAAIERGEQVAFTGGEPTLHQPLPSWLRAASERGAARVLLQTNGRRLAYLAYARALRGASDVLALDVSLHGSTEAMHDYHTGVDGSFAQTQRGLRHARALRIPAGVTTVVTRSNFRHLAEIVRVAKALGAAAIDLAPAERFGRAARDADRVAPSPELVAPYLEAARAEARRHELPVIAAGGEGLFAGLGEVEVAEARGPVAPAQPPRRSLPLANLGRPAPALREVHSAARRTGSELAAIFPDLFAAGAPGREGSP